MLIVLLAACDPGWGYRVPGAREVNEDGRHFELAGPSQTTLRAHANLFTSSLRTILTITNDASTPITIQPDRLRATNREGKELERTSYRTVVRCVDHEADEQVSLPPGKSCRMFADFHVRPDADLLKTVTLTHDGVMRDGVAVPVTVRLEKD